MTNKKLRVPIPPELSAQALFLSDRTCCVCRIRGKPVQIHHIDDDPSHNELNNLAVLCFDCHRDTQLRGGFDRKLDAEQIILYREDWNRLVGQSRASVSATTDRDSATEVQLELATSIAEIHREKKDFVQLATHYDVIGNEDLRDKYVEIAIQQGVDDATLIFLRGTLQNRPDLIPQEVADRELERRARDENWTQRARALLVLGRYEEAAQDYLKGVQVNLDIRNYFTAAFYLKELVTDGLIEHLFVRALKEAIEEDDLWRQVRSLQELGWHDELRERLLAQTERIKQSRNPMLLEVLAWAREDWRTYIRVRKAIEQGTSSGPDGMDFFPSLLPEDSGVDENDHPDDPVTE
jgi:tetratricopeptide (TPR) repeat protein